MMGMVYKKFFQFDQPIEEFLKVIDINPEHIKPYNNISMVYFTKKNFRSIRNYQKAISINPENLEALNNLAVAYKRSNQLERAKTFSNQALAVNLAHAGTPITLRWHSKKKETLNL